MRARRTRMEEAAKEGSRSAKLALHQMDNLSQYLSAAQVGITFTSIGLGFLGEPAVASLLEPHLRRRPEPRRVRRDLGRDRLHARHLGARDRGRAGAEDDGDHARRAHRALVRAAAGVVQDRSASRDLGAQRRVQLRRQENPADRRRERRRGRDRRGAARADRARRALRGARPERGRHARGRVPSARAGGAPGDDADACARDGQQRRHGGDRAAALHHLRSHAPRRDRGRQPRPRARRRALEPPRADADERRAARRRSRRSCASR